MSASRRALLGLVFGDVYGLQYECLWLEPRLTWLNESDVSFGCMDECGGRCCYSDDTEMSIALIECLDTIFKPRELAECVVKRLSVWKRVRYYGTYVKSLASYLLSGINWSNAVKLMDMDLCARDPSPAVRIVPVASAVPNLDVVLEVAATQTLSTHPCTEAVERSMLTAFVANLVSIEGLSIDAALDEALHHERLGSYARKLSSEILSVIDEPPYAVVSKLRKRLGYVTAVELGLVAAIKSRNVVDALAKALSLGGDVDTSAAIACSLKAAKGFEPPRDLMTRIEDIESIYLLANLLSIRISRVMRAS